MDRIPGGGAPDGAFERFLTAALATIITIMFSWRLLQEENEASGFNERSNTQVPTTYKYHSEARARFQKMASDRRPNSRASNQYDISLDELDDSESENNINNTDLLLSDSSVRETVTYDRLDPKTCPALGASSPSHISVLDTPTDTNANPPSAGDETLTTWDDLDWEEESGQGQQFVLKTRRSVRDFVKCKSNPVTEMSINDTGQTESRTNAKASSPMLSFSQRMANFEYSDTGGDSGYVDLYPDVDSDQSDEESSDEEHEYEIQVSDSDSDSPDERTGSFYGVTALDTIFEEFESDIEEEAAFGEICDKDVLICDKGDQISDEELQNNDKSEYLSYGNNIPSDREDKGNPFDRVDKSDTKQAKFEIRNNLDSNNSFLIENQNHPVQETIFQAVSQNVTETPVSFVQNIDGRIISQSEHSLSNLDRIRTTRPETTEINTPSDILYTANNKTNLDNSLDTVLFEKSEHFDRNVNDIAPLTSGISHSSSQEGKTGTRQISDINRQSQMTENGVTPQDGEIYVSQSNTHSLQQDSNSSQSNASPIQIEFSKLQEKMKVPRLILLQKETPTEKPEESLPSSPVRNAALDAIADDKFSDTESCSSESVITVISVKSNESEHYPIERRDVTRDSCITPVHVMTDEIAVSDTDKLASINTTDNSYEHNSLVSGFLNDSLNSLLSANNINDMGNDSDLDLSEFEKQGSPRDFERVEEIETTMTSPREEIVQVSDETGEQSENSSKTSSADSLSIELARVQHTNQINTELSNQAANTSADEYKIESRISDALKSQDLRILDDSDRFIGSDSSSDSSDPPLREYDPDDDDLAAFQFNQDIDNDSFYLLVGDEGSLRNYETFTNLNSIGLSSEYHDAFTSHTFPDDARGFTISRTEDLGTQFRRQTYFTDRSNLSEGDSLSEKGLSPIASEDEEIACLPEPESLNAQPLSIQENREYSNSSLLKYKDADLSRVNTSFPPIPSFDKSDQKSIDFQKYIIHPERKTGSIDNHDQEQLDSQNGDKDSWKIDKEFIETKGPKIDRDQWVPDRSGVNVLNNTVDTNNSSVPCTNSTESSRQLETNTDFDRDVIDNRFQISVDTDQNAKDELEDNFVPNNSDIYVQKQSVFVIKNDLSHQQKNDDQYSDRLISRAKIETNVDEILGESLVTREGVDESRETQTQNVGTLDRILDVNKPHKETCIDDLFVESVEKDRDNISSRVIVVSKPHRETCIDDAFDNEASLDSGQSSSLSSRGHVETNIDEIFEELSQSEKSRNISKSRETNIDDVFEIGRVVETRKSKDSHAHLRPKVETNVDDLVDGATPVAVAQVQSTPLYSKPSFETNVDDIEFEFKPRNTQPSHRKSVETFVDDLFRDVGLEQEEIVPLERKNVESVNKPTYETFVDDLFNDVLTSNDKCSSLATGRGLESSFSAIKRQDTAEIKDSPNIGVLQSVHRNNSVQDLPDKHLQTDCLKYSSLAQIERDIESNKTSDPKPNFDCKQRSISITDNANIDFGSDNNLNVSFQVSTKECQNTPSINLSSSSAKIGQQKIAKRDTIEPEIFTNTVRDLRSIPSSYSRNNSGPGDTENVESGIITKENNKNDIQNKSEIDKEQTIKNPTDNGSFSVNSNYKELNGQKLHVIDYNANVSLTNSGGLNNVTSNDNWTDLGPSPVGYIRAKTNPVIVEPNIHRTSSDEENICGDSIETAGKTDANEIELKIVEDSDNSNLDITQSDTLSSIGSCSIYSDDESLSSIEESYHSLQNSYNSSRLRGLSDSSIGRVVRNPAVKPSTIFGKSKEYQGVKRRVHRHQLKKYTSILQQPLLVDAQNAHLPEVAPEKPISVARLKVLQSRQKFLSAENLSNSSFEERFLHYRTSFTSSTPRKYLKRHERSIAELQSTESLPADMSAMDFMNNSYGSYNSMDRIHSLPVSRQIEELYNSRYSSANSSFERQEYDKLHANCIFTPEKREEIRHTTKSLENMFEQLLRYGSVSSLAETDLDAASSTQHGSFPPDIDITDYVSFQYPLGRAASMSALTGSSEGHRLPRKPGKGRFASRNVPKSKSLQTLETNLDDVFATEDELSGELKKTPSVHELRVSNSLTKLNVPDWFRKSSFSRSGSTQSLFTYAARQGSTSTLGSSIYPPSITASPSSSVTPGSNTVIITKRVTATPSTPSTAKLLRAPLPTTPEKSPIHNTPVSLPSDKFRKSEKNLKPIAIVPFAKLREMFEKKAQEDLQAKSPVTSPTKEKPPVRVRFESMTQVNGTSIEPIQSLKRETLIDNEPVQMERTMSPPPPLPDRKPILADSSRKSENQPQSAQPRTRMQVHFSDEKPPLEQVSRSQEQNNTNNLRQNGTTPSTNVNNSKEKPVKKPQGFRASLPLPQFRFRRPGKFVTKSSTPSSSSSTAVPPTNSTQSKKGKTIYSSDLDPEHDCGYCDQICNNNKCVSSLVKQPWLHALESKTKIDGETLFEFLQKRRYSSILENGFAEQMEELQDRDVAFNFPILSLGKHSNGDMGSKDRAPDLQVVLTNAYTNNNAPYGFVNNKLRNDASMDDILDGLLLLDGHRTGRFRMDEQGRIVPKHTEDFSPDTPPGFALRPGSMLCDMYTDDNDNVFEECNSEYMLVTCENPDCKRETNLREAKLYFKTCHSCFTYYCSRKCRKDDWVLHKKVCIYSRINSACKHVIKFINRQPELQYQCSRIARRGYLAQGRGCVMFAFPDISSSEDFLNYGFESLWVPPVYISLRELPNASMLGCKLEILSETCLHYNPELKYVIHVAIVIPPKLPLRPVPRRIESIIQKSAKLRLSPAHMHPRQENADIPSTLILTAVPGNQHADDQDGRKTRELCFINIQRKLRQRGVSLRHQFPDVYNKLIDFVSDAKHFSPLIIYPSDGRTGRKFMCVIMPESEPEIEWIRDPNLFHELDVFEDEEIATPNLSLNLQEVLL